MAVSRWFHDTAVIVSPAGRINVEAVVVIAGITVGSLYVSTVARSGIRALLGAIAAFGVFGFLVTTMQAFGVGRRVYLAVHAARGVHAHRLGLYMSPVYSELLQCAFLLLILVLAATNYRSAARSPRVLAAHAAILVACVVVYDVGLSALAALMF
jgi:hypothetical protein